MGSVETIVKCGAGNGVESCGIVQVCGRWHGHNSRHDAPPPHLGRHTDARRSRPLPCLVIKLLSSGPGFDHVLLQFGIFSSFWSLASVFDLCTR